VPRAEAAFLALSGCYGGHGRVAQRSGGAWWLWLVFVMAGVHGRLGVARWRTLLGRLGRAPAATGDTPVG
jgi:hypothetical protein